MTWWISSQHRTIPLNGFRKWTKLGNKMQVETFIFRMKALDTDFSTYVGNMIIMILKNYIQFKWNTWPSQIISRILHNCISFNIICRLYSWRTCTPRRGWISRITKSPKKRRIILLSCKRRKFGKSNAFCRLCMAEQLGL